MPHGILNNDFSVSPVKGDKNFVSQNTKIKLVETSAPVHSK